MPSSCRKKFLPVIHCVSPSDEQGIGHALANVRIAKLNGADGVFLIGHGLHFVALSEIYQNVRKHFPDLWIGANFLDISHNDWSALASVARNCYGLNALWTDGMPETRAGLPSSIKIFGGVAFKYINPNLGGKELERECAKALKFADVATTSGNKTGSPPEISKLEIINKLLGGLPLALASGVNATNVLDFCPYVDIFLVATSITERNPDRGGHEYLIEEKVREMAHLIHGY